MSPRHPRPRVALLTGASSGIGEALAAALAARGTHVLLAARGPTRIVGRLNQLMAQSARLSPRALTARISAALLAPPEPPSHRPHS
jgi:NADP-dependent 3-hydroxy acid dehydrogenase YdfG